MFASNLSLFFQVRRFIVEQIRVLEFTPGGFFTLLHFAFSIRKSGEDPGIFGRLIAVGVKNRRIPKNDRLTI